MNAVALKLHAALVSQLNLLGEKWRYSWQRRREANRLREQQWRDRQAAKFFKTQDSIRRGEHWPTMKLLLQTGDWNIDPFRKDLLTQLEHTVFDELTPEDVDGFSGRMQRTMLLIFRLWDEPFAKQMFWHLCDHFGEACIQQDLQNIQTMWNDFFPSTWFSKTTA